jgi:hypothetical protein
MSSFYGEPGGGDAASESDLASLGPAFLFGVAYFCVAYASV